MSHKPQDELKRELEEAGKKVRVGDYYSHFKNPDHCYRIEFLGFLESNDEIHVGYRGMYGEKFLFLRPLTIFLETVEVNGKKVPRFQKTNAPRHASNRLAVGVILISKEGKLCYGKRKTFTFIGEYSHVVGHVETGESYLEAGVREVFEETGLKIKKEDLKLVAVSTHLNEGVNLHYGNVDLIVENIDSSKVRLMEPEKCEGWEWFALDKLPPNVCEPDLFAIAAYKHWKKTGKVTIK